MATPTRTAPYTMSGLSTVTDEDTSSNAGEPEQIVSENQNHELSAGYTYNIQPSSTSDITTPPHTAPHTMNTLFTVIEDDTSNNVGEPEQTIVPENQNHELSAGYTYNTQPSSTSDMTTPPRIAPHTMNTLFTVIEDDTSSNAGEPEQTIVPENQNHELSAGYTHNAQPSSTSDMTTPPRTAPHTMNTIFTVAEDDTSSNAGETIVSENENHELSAGYTHNALPSSTSDMTTPPRTAPHSMNAVFTVTEEDTSSNAGEPNQTLLGQPVQTVLSENQNQGVSAGYTYNAQPSSMSPNGLTPRSPSHVRLRHPPLTGSPADVLPFFPPGYATSSMSPHGLTPPSPSHVRNRHPPLTDSPADVLPFFPPGYATSSMSPHGLAPPSPSHVRNHHPPLTGSPADVLSFFPPGYATSRAADLLGTSPTPGPGGRRQSVSVINGGSYDGSRNTPNFSRPLPPRFPHGTSPLRRVSFADELTGPQTLTSRLALGDRDEEQASAGRSESDMEVRAEPAFEDGAETDLGERAETALGERAEPASEDRAEVNNQEADPASEPVNGTATEEASFEDFI